MRFHAKRNSYRMVANGQHKGEHACCTGAYYGDVRCWTCRRWGGGCRQRSWRERGPCRRGRGSGWGGTCGETKRHTKVQRRAVGWYGETTKRDRCECGVRGADRLSAETRKWASRFGIQHAQLIVERICLDICNYTNVGTYHCKKRKIYTSSI